MTNAWYTRVFNALGGTRVRAKDVKDEFTLIQTAFDSVYTEGRRIVTSGLKLYVRKDGSDSNTGLANTAGGAFLTIGKAQNVAATYDNRWYTIEIVVGDGAYAEIVHLSNNRVSQIDAYSIYLTGNPVTPANVTVQGIVLNYGVVAVNGFALTTSPLLMTGGYADITNCRFAQASGSGIFAGWGALAETGTGNTFAGSSDFAINSESATINVREVVTVSGTPVYAQGFARASRCGTVRFFNQPTGSATGPRYSAVQNGVVVTPTGSSTYLPGDSIVVPTSGGQYAAA